MFGDGTVRPNAPAANLAGGFFVVRAAGLRRPVRAIVHFEGVETGMNALLRYLELLNRGQLPQGPTQSLPGGPYPPGAHPIRPHVMPAWFDDRSAGLLESMREDERPRGLLGLIEESGFSAPEDEEVPAQELGQADPNAMPGSAGAAPVSPIPPIPAHKKDFLNEPHWAALHSAMNRVQGLGPNARSALGRTFAEEGGMTPNAHSGAVAGIMPATFDEIRRSGRIPELANVTSVSQLTPELAALLYRDIGNQRLRTVGGIAALEQLTPGASGALYDSLFQHGGAGGTGFVQEAINKIVGDLAETDRRRLAIAPLVRDRKMGPATLGALKKLIDDTPEMAARLLGALADKRSEPVNGQPRLPGETKRFDLQR
jgi:hypothetical protein